jgi:DNA polymerase-3 subunit beta
MKVIVHRESLLSAFSQAATVVSRRSTNQVRNYIRLAVDEGETHMTATDLEHFVRIPVAGVTVIETGTALLPTTTFGSLLREVREESLKIVLSGDNLIVAGTHSEFRLPTMAVEEFPEVAVAPPEAHHVVAAKALRTAISRTVFCCDPASVQFALGGVMFALGDMLTAVATDGLRLAKFEAPVMDRGQGAKDGHVVTERGVKALVRMLADYEGDVNVALTSNYASFSCERFVLRCRLLDGRFPEWQKVIRNDYEWSIQVAAGTLAQAIRQVGVTASVDHSSDGVDFSFTPRKLSLYCESGAGVAQVEIPVTYSGAPVSTRLRYRDMLDCLKWFADETVLRLLIDDGPNRPVQLRDDLGYCYLIMPMIPKD